MQRPGFSAEPIQRRRLWRDRRGRGGDATHPGSDMFAADMRFQLICCSRGFGRFTLCLLPGLGTVLVVALCVTLGGLSLFYSALVGLAFGALLALAFARWARGGKSAPKHTPPASVSSHY